MLLLLPPSKLYARERVGVARLFCRPARPHMAGRPSPDLVYAADSDEEDAQLAVAFAASVQVSCHVHGVVAAPTLQEQAACGPAGAAEPDAEPEAVCTADVSASAVGGTAHVSVSIELRQTATRCGARCCARRCRQPPIATDSCSGACEPPPELWAYAVWCIPGHASWRGVHGGGGAAWGALLGPLGGRYSYRLGHRLRRFPSVAEALAAYRHEAPMYGQADIVIAWVDAKER